MEKRRCILCGAYEAQKDAEDEYYCSACKGHFTEKLSERQVVHLAMLFGEEFARQKTDELYTASKNLRDAVTEKFTDEDKIKRCCVELRKYKTEDFRADFYEAVCNGNAAAINMILGEINVEEDYPYIYDALHFILKNPKYENLTAINNLITRAYENKDVRLFDEFNRLAQKKSKEIDDGIYDATVLRDCFIAYKSEDMPVVEEVVDYLEGEGLSCFVAARNLPHGSISLYEKELETAIRACKVFVFISTEKSRMGGNARNKEMKVVKEDDFLRAPAGYAARSDYSFSVDYKKPRAEYVVEAYQNKQREIVVKEFFDGFERVNAPDLNELVKRINDQIDPLSVSDRGDKREHKSAREAFQNTKYCLSCGQENPERAKLCMSCGKTEFVATHEEYINHKNEEAKKEGERIKVEAQRVAKEEAERKKFEAEVAAEKTKKEAAEEVARKKREAAAEVARARENTERLEAEIQVKLREAERRLFEAEEIKRREALRAKAKKDAIAARRAMNQMRRDTAQREKQFKQEALRRERDQAIVDGRRRLPYYNMAMQKVGSALTGIFGGASVILPIVMFLFVTTFMTKTEEAAIAYNLLLCVIAAAAGWIVGLILLMVGARRKNRAGIAVGILGAISVTLLTGASYFYAKETAKTFEYELNNGTATICRFNEFARGEVVIPSTIKGRVVTHIGDSAFSRCVLITSVRIPDSVTSIGDNAFYKCSRLKSIMIPDSVTLIGASAFQSCGSLTSITIPDSVAYLGVGVFENCSGLKSVEIPGSVTSIVDNAFSGCSGLTSIAISDSVTSIGASAFANCGSLANIDLPDGVTSIGASAFANCGSLKSIEIPNNVTQIGRFVFQNCSGLQSVSMGNGITRIEDYVFSGCSGLTNIAISDSVTTIGDFAFANCSGLKFVTIPNSVISIGIYVFNHCDNLSSIYFLGTREQWFAIHKSEDLEDEANGFTIWCRQTALS